MPAHVEIDIDLPTSGEFCFGRDEELQKLSQSWSDGSKNIISIVARGGEGKTTLVNHWLGEMTGERFCGAERVFARSFYSQGTSDQAASADKVIDEALRYFGEQNPEELAPHDRGIELARRVGSGRNLLILDGMEPLQYPPGEMEGEIKDPALKMLLKTLQFRNDGLCLVTTREEIRPLQGSVGHEQIILRRLTLAACRQLLKKLGVTGDQQAIELAIEENQGHALAVTLLGTYLVERFDGDIANVDRVTYPPGFNGEQPSLPSTELLKGREWESGRARKMIASYEKWFADEPDEVNGAALVILRFMGLFNRPPEPSCIAALREKPIAGLSEALFAGNDLEETWRKAVVRLQRARLLDRSDHGWNEIECHPLIREYFATSLDRNFADAAREAHRRLYEHLKQSAPKLPANLNDMMPLYHAVAHGCIAGLIQDALDHVFMARIQRGGQYFAAFRLGAFSMDLRALSCFFEQTWSKPSPRLSGRGQRQALICTSGTLVPLLRMREVASLSHLLVDRALEERQFDQASNACTQLNFALAMLGHLSEALDHAERATLLADRVGDPFLRLLARSTVGLTLAWCGRWDDSRAQFQIAERIQKERDSIHPLLSHVQGVRYCDVELGDLERRIASKQGYDRKKAVRRCNKLKSRLERIRSWHPNAEPFLAGLFDYVQARLLLIRSIFTTESDLPEALKSGNRAIKLIRSAMAQHELPRVLLVTAAIYRRLREFDESSALIDEAEELISNQELAPLQVECRIERCDVLRKLEKWQEAEEECDSIVRLVQSTESTFDPKTIEFETKRSYLDIVSPGIILGYHYRKERIESLKESVMTRS